LFHVVLDFVWVSSFFLFFKFFLKLFGPARAPHQDSEKKKRENQKKQEKPRKKQEQREQISIKPRVFKDFASEYQLPLPLLPRCSAPCPCCSCRSSLLRRGEAGPWVLHVWLRPVPAAESRGSHLGPEPSPLHHA
jgi:hypothetical protein